MQKIIFTLCSNNYLAQAKTLGDSISMLLPEYQFVIGLVDKMHPDVDYEFFSPHQVLPYDQIGFDVFGEMVERYNIVEFNTAVKPFYFEYLAKQSQDSSIIMYIDPDILLHKPLTVIEDLLTKNDFVLTPHLIYAHKKQGQFEKLVLNVGVFNLGFLALKVTDQTLLFMQWWQNRLINDCRISFSEGLFVDQIWANYIPCLHENVAILRGPGYNVGYWNFSERSLIETEEGYLVNSEYPLVFFHYSSYSPLKPDTLCKWLSYSFDERPDLKNIYNDYRSRLLTNKYEEYHELPRVLNFKLNHPFADNNIKSVTHVKEKKFKAFLSLRKKMGNAAKRYSNRLISFLFGV